MEFNNWYKRTFEERKEIPPEEVWEKISEEMDLDEVWGRVNSELDKKDRRRKAIIISLSAAVSALLLVGGLYYGNKEDVSNTDLGKNVEAAIENKKRSSIDAQLAKNTPKESRNVSDEKKEEKVTKESVLKTETVKTIINNSNTSKPIFAERLPSLRNLNDIEKQKEERVGIIIEKVAKTESLSNSEEINQSPLKLLPYRLASVYYELTIPDSILRAIHLDNKPVVALSNYYPCFAVGFSITGANTWLLNNDTYIGLKANTLTKSFLSFGKSYSVFAAYDWSQRFAFQAEWVINNIQKQGYTNYANGKLSDRMHSLNFTQFNLIAKRKREKSTFSGNVANSFNYLAGLQLGLLKSSSQTIADVSTDVKKEYSKYDYGFILGLEYQLILKQYFVISASVRSNIGFKNIYVGNGIIPSYLNKTYNSSLGVNLGLAYRFQLK